MSGISERKKSVAASLLVGLLVACSSIPEAKPSCANEGCGPHGTCTFVGDSESCVCETGYAGPMCAECAPGFQDIDGNGLCAGSCADLACGAHERCSEVSGRPLCDCVVGYSRTDDGVCAFTGGPVDPSFDNPQPNGWATRGAATIEVGKTSDVGGGRGWARFGGLGEVFQSFEMPSYADAEPLALELERTCARMGACSSVRSPLGIALDDRLTDRWFSVAQSGLPAETVQVCLGERAFGRKLTFGLRAYPSPFLSEGRMSSREDALIGRAQFVPSTACAAPGTVKNGDFEGGDWKIVAGDGDPGVTFVEENGTRLARMESVCGAGRPLASSIVTSISIPESLERPALAFSHDGTLGGRTRVSIDGHSIGGVRGTGAREKAVVCLPASSSGFAFELRVDVEADCDSRKPNVVRVDDFVVTSDPACVSDETVINGGFERTGAVTWVADPPVPATTVVIQDPARAHSGTAYLELRASCGANESIAGWTGWVPPRLPDASGGPAVKLWYRLPRAAFVTVRAGDAYMPEPEHRLEPAATWTERIVCLPRHSWGRPTGLRIELFPSGDGAGNCVPSQVDLDDLSIASDPSCPLD